MSGHGQTIDEADRENVGSARISIDDEFISRISHDLRTPLAAIKAAIGVVLANEPSGTAEPLSRMFRNIDRAADQMNSMIANIAESARLAPGAGAMRCDFTDVRDILRRVARTTEIAARRQDQHVEVHSPADPCLVHGDAMRIERALLNLLENAQKHGRQGGTIGLSLESEATEVTFTVTDDGPGVSPEAAVEIFSGRDPAAEGSGRIGLGLPVAKRIAELHGGRIWVEPAAGQGAMFHLVLPVASVAQQASSSTSKPRIKDRNG